MKENFVWEFTNQRKLNKSEFLNYFERKVFKTIRKFGQLTEDKKISLKNGTDLNTLTLKKILEKKFEVKFSNSPNFSSKNLSELAEENFDKILKGDFSPIKEGFTKSGKRFLACPLYSLLDEEVELYAKLAGIKGTKRKRNEKVQKLFSKFKSKNQDLEVNVMKAAAQLPK